MNRRIGLIALAVVLALAGTFAVYTYAHNADKRAVDRTRSVQVLYAQKGIPVGTSWGDAVKAGYFSTERIPAHSAPSTALGDTNASVPLDQVATFNIASGQIVIREMFSDKVATTGILAIPKGLQAVSITLPSNADAAGFIQNGSAVAVYGTYEVGGPATHNTTNTSTDPFPGIKLPKIARLHGKTWFITKLLVARASVIATSQDAPSDLHGGASGNSSNNVLITLAVTQADAQRIINAQSAGTLYLSLLTDSSVTAPDPGATNIGGFTPKPIYER